MVVLPALNTRDSLFRKNTHTHTHQRFAATMLTCNVKPSQNKLGHGILTGIRGENWSTNTMEHKPGVACVVAPALGQLAFLKRNVFVHIYCAYELIKFIIFLKKSYMFFSSYSICV
jgi:hypothetical protein